MPDPGVSIPPKTPDKDASIKSVFIGFSHGFEKAQKIADVSTTIFTDKSIGKATT